MLDHLSFSVVICVHSDERTELSVKAIRSAMAQTHKPDEIIVVADHNPRLADELARHCPEARVIQNRGRKGLSGARNTGCEAARFDVIAFLDDDAEADLQWLSGMASHYANPCVMGVGGHVEPVWRGRAPSWFPEEFNWVVGCSYRGLPSTAADVRNLIGCNMSFRREMITMLGGFRESLGRDGGNAFGCEETDLCIRATQMFSGWRIVYDPAVVVRHHVSEDRKSIVYFLLRCLAEGRSKAIVVNRNGRHSGLSSERSYVWKILPTGIAAGFADATRGRLSGLGRAAAIVAGFLPTAFGYADFRFLRPSRAQAADPFQPVQIVEIDLDAPLGGRRLGTTEKAPEYGGLFVFVRKGGRPAATVELPSIRPFDDTQLFRWLLSAHLKREAMDPVPVPVHPVPISVVVATRDRPAQLARCLDSLVAQSYADFEIIVVDNAPSDNRTQQLIGDGFGGRVRYVRELRPGLAQAHNAGAARARHELIAFTDDDVVCDRGWLSAMVSGFETGDDVGCVTGLILPMELDTRAQYWTERHGGFAKGFRRRRFDMQSECGPGPLYPLAAGQFGSGAAMAFRRTALEKIGFFDAALGAGTRARGGDDLHSFASVILSGLAIVYEPAAVTWHQHRRDEVGMQRQAYGYGVGLGAYITSMVAQRPSLIWKILAGLPAGIEHMMGPRSKKLARLPQDYPRSFVWLERLGILLGPLAYVNSRRSLARALKTSRDQRLVDGTKAGVGGS
jgi:GT2 family glycosyltransferase